MITPEDVSKKSFADEVGEKVASLASELFFIPGIVKLRFARYEIGIEKGQVFTWEEITPSVLEALRHCLFEPDVKLEITHERFKLTYGHEDNQEDSFVY